MEDNTSRRRRLHRLSVAASGGEWPEQQPTKTTLDWLVATRSGTGHSSSFSFSPSPSPSSSILSLLLLLVVVLFLFLFLPVCRAASPGVPQGHLPDPTCPRAHTTVSASTPLHLVYGPLTRGLFQPISLLTITKVAELQVTIIIYLLHCHVIGITIIY